MQFIAAALTCALIAFALPELAAGQGRQKFILDTDIAGDIDDAFALSLLCSDPNADLIGVTTAGGHTAERALVAAKLLDVIGRKNVPVYAGRSIEGTFVSDQFLWAKDFQSNQLRSRSAVSFIHSTLNKWPGQITIVAIGPLTNLGDLLTKYPQDKGKIKRIVLMGGSVYVGYNNKPPAAQEYNLRVDPKSAQVVFRSSSPIVMAGLEVTCMMQLNADLRKQLWSAGTRVTDALSALTQLWGHPEPTLYDPFAVGYALGQRFCDSEQCHIDVDEKGMTTIGKGKANVTLLLRPKPPEFLEWCVKEIGSIR